MNERELDDYADESEMRRVFGLVYDVLRCEFIIIKIDFSLTL